MIAVAIYVDRLTKLRGMKVKAVAERAGVKPGYVSRVISKDVKEPSATILRALVEAVSGSWEDAGVLLDPRADRAQAEALADAWYARTTQVNGTNNDALRQRLLAAVDDLLGSEDQLRRELRQP